MGKVKVSIDGGEEVIVKIPKGVKKDEFADAIASAVTQTLQIIHPKPIHTFHPVLGQGGFNWDHENQRAVVRKTQAPSVEVHRGRIANVRFYLQGLWRHILRYDGSVHKELD